MIRSSSSSFFRWTARHQRNGNGIIRMRRTAGSAYHHHAPALLFQANHSSTEAITRPSINPVSDNETDNDANNSNRQLTEGEEAGKTHHRHPHPKQVSFFDEVDELMKRDSPSQYQRFLESKTSYESWREMQQRNEQSRRRQRRLVTDMQRDDVATRDAEASAISNIFEKKDVPPEPWYKQNEEDKQLSDTANNGTEVDTNNSMDDEEVPWYKQRKDMTDFASEKMGGDTVSAGATLPSKYKNFFQTNLGESSSSTSPTTSTISSTSTTSATFTNTSENETSTKKSSIFSSISKSALSLKDADGNTSTTIPLSELFPTLYGNDAQMEAKKKKPTNPAMMYDADSFETYHEAVTAVLDTDRSTQRVLSKYESRGEVEKRVVQAVKDWLLNDHRIVESEVVKERWVAMDEVWNSEKWMTGVSESSASRSDGENEEDNGEKAKKDESRFALELRAQREVFLSKLFSEGSTAMTSSSTPSLDDSALDSSTEQEQSDATNEALTLEQVDPILFFDAARNIMGALGRYCARRARSSPMEVAWWKVKESGLTLPKDVISTYLYVVGTMGMADSLGLGSARRSIGSSFSPLSDDKKESELEEEDSDSKENDKFLIPEEVATYHDLLSKPTESSMSLRIKSLASKGDAKSAEMLLEAFKKSIEADESSKELIRLRTYLPILKQYCDVGDISAALSLFKRMMTTNGVVLEPENYVLLLASIAENKYFCDDSPPIEGAHDLGYSHSSGPGLFDELASEMAADALEITSASARRLYNSLAIGFQNNSSSDSEESSAVASPLKQVHPLMTMPLTRQPANSNELVASRVALDRSTGVCPVTAAQQRLIVLEPDQRKQLHDDLLDLSTEQFKKWAGEKANHSDNPAREQLQQFSDWLDEREDEPFTAIVDGANVGYYMQSFDKGIFNYHQINFMVNTLEERGENPLVIIPNKYGNTGFFSSKGEKQRLDRTEIGIMNKLMDSGKLYRVPPGCLDDFYWMLASVSEQSASRKGKDLSVSNDDPDGRFPGTRPMLITNDQMRDHKLELLEPRLFRRWYGCHIVNYNFTAFVLGESVANNVVGFSAADFFSREIQGNECPLNTDQDEQANWRGHAWHFPVSDWDLDERFVIKIPVKDKDT